MTRYRGVRVFRITKSWSIDCAHQLPAMPEGHPCGRLHGHTYGITLTLASWQLDAAGMVVDFGLLSEIVKAYDHHSWNDYLEQPTSERIAYFLYERVLERLHAAGHDAIRVECVRVSETPSSSAEYTP